MAKKTFIDGMNPAEFFITKPEEEPVEKKQTKKKPATAPEKAPEGYKPNYLYIETKSKRLQLLVQPSLLEKLKKKADAEGRSVNDLVHTILEEALRKE